MRRAVEVRLEAHAVIRDLAELGQAEDLKPAAVREDRARPPDETMQPAHFSHNLVPRPHIQVIGVVEYQTNTQLLQVLRLNPFDRP